MQSKSILGVDSIAKPQNNLNGCETTGNFYSLLFSPVGTKDFLNGNSYWKRLASLRKMQAI